MKYKIRYILQYSFIGFVLTFHTPVFAAVANVKTLQQAVTMALATHPKVGMALNRVRAARSGIDEAKGGFYPSIDLSYAHGREKSELPGQSSTVLSRLERQVSMSEMLFDGRQTRHRVSEKQFQTLSEQFSLIDQSQKIALDTTNVYLDVLLLRKILQLNKSNIALHQSFVKKMTELYRGRAGTKTDVQLAKSRLLLIQSRFIETQKILENTEINYMQYVGVKPGLLTMPNMHFGDRPRELASLIKCAKAHLPVLKKDQASYASLKASAHSQRGAFLPRVTLDVLSSRNNNINGIPGVNNNTRVVLTARYNIFRGGADRAILQQRESIALEARYKLNDDMRQLYRDVKMALNNWFADQQYLSQQRKRLQEIRGAVEGFNQQFLIGRRPLLNVLDMEKELFETKVAVAQAEFSVLKDNYALYASTGMLLEHLHVDPKNREDIDDIY